MNQNHYNNRRPEFKMTLGTHFFRINNPTPKIQSLLNQFMGRFVQKGLVKEQRRFVMKPIRTWPYESKDRSEYRFHINQLPEWITILERNYIRPEHYDTITKPLFNPERISLRLRSKYVLRDYQDTIKSYITTPYDPSSTDPRAATRDKVVELQTGGGKTVTALAAALEIGKRVLIMIKPAFIKKWCGDVLDITDAKPSDLMTVQGGAQLAGIIDLAKRGQLKAKIIIMANRTFQNYLTEYEKDIHDPEVGGYHCKPEDFYETLKIGLLLADEVHLEFYSTYRAHTYMNVPGTIGLSATLVNSDPFLERMYDTVFPKKARFAGLAHKKYIKTYAVAYEFDNVDAVRTTEWGSTVYSHNAFEKSILKKHKLLQEYLLLVKYLTDLGFVRDYKPGDKLIVFAGTIALCTELTKYLRRLYPQFSVERYVEDDPYENIIRPDIRVTTILSGGTAIDIPNLRTAIMTTNIVSIQANIQSLGRLRELKDRDVKFYFAYCSQIPKHQEYYVKRIEMMKEKVLSIQDINYPYTIKTGMSEAAQTQASWWQRRDTRPNDVYQPDKPAAIQPILGRR